MTRKKAIRITILICAGVCLGGFLNYQYTRNPLFVCLTIENRSAKTVQSFKIKHEHGTETVSDILNGEIRKVKFFAGEKPDYEVIAEFADKTKLRCKRDAKGGYKVTVRIFENVIKTQTAVLFLSLNKHQITMR